MVPIPEWAAFTDKGGSKAIVTLPIDEVQKVIIACIQARKQLIEDVYPGEDLGLLRRRDRHLRGLGLR
jgi:hypothetical protein